jgi:predicted nucleotidyltransferase
MSVTLELARQVGASDRSLRRAVVLGLVRGRRATANKLMLAPGEAEYVRDHWSLLQGLRSALRTEPSVQTAVLYGSTARGDDAPDSDIDLAVVIKIGADLHPYDLARRLARRLERDVQVIDLERALRDPCFAFNIIEDGRPVVDRAGLWPRLRRRRAALTRAAAVQRVERENEMTRAFRELLT